MGFEDKYEVSDHGIVRSIPDGQPLRQYVANKVGHLRVVLKRPEGGRLQQYVHRLVLTAFVGPCPEGAQCCHNDGDATNNRLENLRWDTQSSNVYDRVRHGTHHHANRTHCPKGHPLDAVKRRPDGTIRQRRCTTCSRIENRAKRANKTHCPQGHPFDGVAYWPDGSVRQRFCKRCRSESVSRQMSERHAKARAEKTHCKYGHPMDGLRKRMGAGEVKMVPYCKTCLRESSRRNAAKKKV